MRWLICFVVALIAVGFAQDKGERSASERFNALRRRNAFNSRPVVLRLPRPTRPPINVRPSIRGRITRPPTVITVTNPTIPRSFPSANEGEKFPAGPERNGRLFLPENTENFRNPNARIPPGVPEIIPDGSGGFGSPGSRGFSPDSGALNAAPGLPQGFGSFGGGRGPPGFPGDFGNVPVAPPAPPRLPPAVAAPSFPPIVSAPAPPPQQPQISPQISSDQIKEYLRLAGLGGETRFPGLINPGLPNIARNIPDFGTLNIPQAGSGSFGNLPSNIGGLPQSQFPLPAQSAPADNGLLGILGSLTRRFTSASGVQGLLANAGVSGVPGGGFVPSSGGPVLGIPRIPGLPILSEQPSNPEAGPILGVITALGQRLTGGKALSDVLPADRLQLLADNITETLLPDTAKVELSKFMGRWFEGINSPRSTDQRCMVHHFGGLTENGKTATFTALKIYREGSEFGQVRYSIGYAFRGGHDGGMLNMHSSEEADPMPYWIYKVGPTGKDPFGNEQYEYAVVSNWVRYPVMVLVRDPDNFKETYEVEVLRWLEDNGFINGFVRAFNLLQPVSYANCQYSDSTFEVFG